MGATEGACDERLAEEEKEREATHAQPPPPPWASEWPPPAPCVPHVAACTADYQPKCGRDGVTYSNQCMARNACQFDTTDGPCPGYWRPPPSTPPPPSPSLLSSLLSSLLVGGAPLGGRPPPLTREFFFGFKFVCAFHISLRVFKFFKESTENKFFLF